jgi:FAD/FMN-containing dehydrogenase
MTTSSMRSSISALDEEAVQAFGSTLRGRVLRPGDVGYDDARHVWNAMIDKYPAMIAQCSNASDVAKAVRFAREHGLPLTVKGGGHGVAGKAVTDGGLMIDLSPMQGIAIDAERRVAHVEGGVTWGAFDAATQAAGLATTGGVVATTGVIGLTLGGGIGFLMRHFGLSCDNLLAAEVVTADGNLLTASESAHPDLFWGLRGGGGNFGVVTTMTFRLHEVTSVLGGLIVHPLADAAEVLRFYRDFTAAAPDALGTNLSFAPGPDGEPAIAFSVCYSGPLAEGERVLQPLRDFGRPIADMVRVMSYREIQTLFLDAYPPGQLNYWKSSFLDRLDDEFLERVIERYTAAPSPHLHLHLEHLGGAVGRVRPAVTAFSERSAGFTVIVVGAWVDPEEMEERVRWVRETWQELSLFARDSGYINYMAAGDEARTEAAYGANYARLAALKATYDPTNLFRHNQNIQPAR